MARTYLERHMDEFADCTRPQLIKHGLLALKESLAQDKELTVDNTSLGVVGFSVKDGKRKMEPFRLIEHQDIAPLLEGIEAQPAAEGDAMETDT